MAQDVDGFKARWVRASVEMLEHPVLDRGPFDRRSAWLWLIANAAWKQRRINHKGSPLTLERGQVLIGRSYLAEKWGWSEQMVRTFTSQLVAEDMLKINQSAGHFANVATICNYDKYQTAQPEPNQSSNQCPTSAQPVPNQTLTKNTNITTSGEVSRTAEPSACKPRASRLGSDWKLPDDWRQWARINFATATDAMVAAEADHFRDFWISKAGREAAKLDWEATWRNWCRNSRTLSAAPRASPINNGRMAWDEKRAKTAYLPTPSNRELSPEDRERIALEMERMN